MMGKIRKCFNITKNAVEDQEIKMHIGVTKRKKYSIEYQVNNVE